LLSAPAIVALPRAALLALAGADLDPTLVVGLVLVALIGALALLVFQVRERLARQRGELEPLAHLKAIEAAVRRIAEQRDGLDLRRLEHVLIDIRDAQRRLEERLIATFESQQAQDVVLPQRPLVDAARGGRLAERITARLLAMGFERIEILTPADEFERLIDGDGEVVVEARRGGAPHKGRVALRDGSISDVRMREGYEAFP